MTGMRAGDFTKCKICGLGVAHTRAPLFYRVKIERMGLERQAIERTAAMEMYMGGAVRLARVFEDPIIAKPIHEGTTILVCEACALKEYPVAMLAETA